MIGAGNSIAGGYGTSVSSATASAIAGTVSEFDELMSFNFTVDIDGMGSMGFDKVSGIGGEIEVIERRTGKEANRNRKLPGLTKISSVTLSHGVTANNELFNWFKLGMDLATQGGSVASLRRNVRVAELGTGFVEKKQWTLKNCWCSSFKAGDFDSKSSDVLIEEVVLEVDDIELNEFGEGTTGTPVG